MSHWINKFRYAFRGVYMGIHGQSSFIVHFVAMFLVLNAAAIFHFELWRWVTLILCIALVVISELFNSSIEYLAKAIDKNENEHLRNALDIAAGAVLLAAGFSVIVGLFLFVPKLVLMLF